MNNKFSSYHPTNKNFSDEFKSRNEPSDLQKVDINVLLNRVKNNKEDHASEGPYLFFPDPSLSTRKP